MTGDSVQPATRLFVTREQGFSFAAWILVRRAEAATEAEGARSRRACDLLYKGFFGAHPAVEGEPDLHWGYARLAGGPDPARFKIYFSWLVTRISREAADDPEIDDMVLAEAWEEVCRIRSARPLRPKTAVRPNPWQKTVTPADAHYALAHLLERPPGGAPREMGRQAKLILEAAIEDWRRRTLKMPDETPCPACTTTDVNPLIAAHHLPRCSAHPAIQWLRAANDAADLARGIVGQLGLLPPRAASADAVRAGGATRSRCAPGEWGTFQSLGELQKLVARNPGEPAPEVEHLRVLLTEWEHVLDRSSDPCPDCGAVVALDGMIEHLLTCAAHPAARAAAALEAWLPFTFQSGTKAVKALVAERVALRDELRQLSAATDEYAGNQHWSRDEGAYSKTVDELPWHAARRKAASLLHLVRIRTPGRARPGAMRNALDRAYGKAPRPPGGPSLADDLALLRAALAEVEQATVTYGMTTTCPACERPGVDPARLHEHLVTCHALPANARARQAAAELRCRGVKVELPEDAAARIEHLDPREWRLDAERGDPRLFVERWFRSKREALARLADGKPLSSDASTLQNLVRDWEEIDAARNASCPGCGLVLGMSAAGAHLLGCEELPTARFARTAEERLARGHGYVRFAGPATPAAIRADADRLALALARLEDANAAYWSAMRDGEYGNSIEDPKQVPNWEAARKVARAVLAECTGSVAS